MSFGAKMEIPKGTRIAVIWDSRDPERRRGCFWEIFREQFQEDLNGAIFNFISISESIASGQDPSSELFDKEKTDVIIINWDAINTDPVYGSNIAREFFHHYVPDMNDWASQGGILIVEDQLAGCRLVQTAYDPFTYDAPGEEQKYPLLIHKKKFVNEDLMSSVIYKNLKQKEHPLLENIPKEIDLRHLAGIKQPDWFPWLRKGPRLGIRSYEKRKNRLSDGWFESYSKKWQVLFFADIHYHHPVMLFRPIIKDEKTLGAYVLTTMYIASSELIQIVKNAINLPNTYPSYMAKMRATKRRRQLIWLVWTGLPILIAAIVLMSARLAGSEAIWSIVSAVISGIITAIIELLVGKFKR